MQPRWAKDISDFLLILASETHYNKKKKKVQFSYTNLTFWAVLEVLYHTVHTEQILQSNYISVNINTWIMFKTDEKSWEKLEKTITKLAPDQCKSTATESSNTLRPVTGRHGKTEGMNQLVEWVEGCVVAMERGSAVQQTGTNTSAPIAAEKRSGKRVRETVMGEKGRGDRTLCREQTEAFWWLQCRSFSGARKTHEHLWWFCGDITCQVLMKILFTWETDLLCRSTPGSRSAPSRSAAVCEASGTPAFSPHALAPLQIPCLYRCT